MADTIFIIELKLRTPGGFDSVGRFWVGNDREFAYKTFHNLLGTSTIDDNTVLHMELVESQHGLPLNLLMKGCTLEQVAENCRLITRELFKHYNLEGKEGT